MEADPIIPEQRDPIDIIRERIRTCGLGIDVMVTSSMPIPGAANRWQYMVRQVRPLRDGRYTPLPGSQGWVGPAYNTYETNNSEESCPQGSGDTTQGLPKGVELRPIGIGAVIQNVRRVQLEDGGEIAFFSAPNNVDGECVTS